MLFSQRWRKELAKNREKLLGGAEKKEEKEKKAKEKEIKIAEKEKEKEEKKEKKEVRLLSLWSISDLMSEDVLALLTVVLSVS